MPYLLAEVGCLECTNQTFHRGMFATVEDAAAVAGERVIVVREDDPPDDVPDSGKWSGSSVWVAFEVSGA